MTSSRTTILVLVALLVICFSLAAQLMPQYHAWNGSRSTGDIFHVVLGSSTRMFANSFYVKADAYYHSGYYPTMFDDKTAFQTAHMAEDTGAVNSKNCGDEFGFLGPKRNWIDAFSRHFVPTRHTHLDEGGADDLSGSQSVREILPWLKLSADMDPDNAQTYTVTAFWLRERMNNVGEADAVLHEGLRNCPESYDIFFELGRLYEESYHDHDRARNVWLEGVRLWIRLSPEMQNRTKNVLQLVADWMSHPVELTEQQNDSLLVMEQLSTHLAQLEVDAGNWQTAIMWFKAAQRVSETPTRLEDRIKQLQYQIGLEFMPELEPLYDTKVLGEKFVFPIK